MAKKNELVLLLNSFIKNNHDFNNNISTFVSLELIILGMLFTNTPEMLAHSNCKA
jgi:hypothetical protein